MRRQKDRMGFSGGAEETPIVEVGTYRCAGSLHNGDVTLVITQGNQTVVISPETLHSILEWYKS